MSDVPPPASSKSAIDWGAVTHAVAGLSAVILGALMYFKPWARDLFSILMIVAAIAAIYFSWKHSAWVPGHWFAMLPCCRSSEWCWVTWAGSGGFPSPT